MSTFKIHAENFPMFKRKLKTLQGKARKLKVPHPYFTIVREFEREFVKDYSKWTESYVEIDLIGAEISMSGWRFAASIEHREGGNIIKANPEFPSPDTLTSYATSSPTCDHCNLKRQRNNTYIMYNEKSELTQVGSGCILDFTGHPSAEFYAELYEFVAQYRHREEDEFRFDRVPECYDVQAVVEVAAMFIRVHGYRSTKVQGASTSSMVYNWLQMEPYKYKEVYGHYQEQPTEADKALAKNSIQVINEFNEYELRNVFNRNLKTLVDLKWCKLSDLGFVCYIPEMYAKSLEKRQAALERQKEQREKNLNSEFYGEVAKRYTLELRVTKTIFLGRSNFGGYPQDNFLHIMTDGSNTFVWKTGTNPQEFHNPEKPVFEVTGTVKQHNLYGGAKQTVLTRCKYKLK
jgi:hypothetical protein